MSKRRAAIISTVTPKEQAETFNISKYISLSSEGTPVLNAGVIDPSCGYELYRNAETMTEMPGYKWQISSKIIPGKKGNDDIFVKFLIEHMGPMTMVIFTNKNKTFMEPMQRAVSLGAKSVPPINPVINSEIAKTFLLNVATTENCLSLEQRESIRKFMKENNSTQYFWVVYPGMPTMQDIETNIGQFGPLYSAQIMFKEPASAAVEAVEAVEAADTVEAAAAAADTVEAEAADTVRKPFFRVKRTKGTKGGKSKKVTKRRNKKDKRKTRKYKK